MTVTTFLRSLVRSWPFSRGQIRLVKCLQPLLLGQRETIEGIGSINFPFQPYQWNFFYGIFEPETVHVFEGSLQKGDIVLDIGANVGYFTAVAANLIGTEGQLYSFEPEPVHFSRLQRLVDLNPSHRICAINGAVSNKNGTADFYVCEHPGWHSLREEFPGAPIREKITVETTSLDTFLIGKSLNEPGSVRLAKVDIEGAEFQAFSGAAQCLKEKWVAEWYVEVSPDKNTASLFALLAESGYLPTRYCHVERLWKPVLSSAEITGPDNIRWQ